MKKIKIKNRRLRVILLILSVVFLAVLHYLLLVGVAITGFMNGLWEPTPEGDEKYSDIGLRIVFLQWSLLLLAIIQIVLLCVIKNKKPIYIILLVLFGLFFSVNVFNFISLLIFASFRPIMLAVMFAVAVVSLATILYLSKSLYRFCNLNNYA